VNRPVPGPIPGRGGTLGPASHPGSGRRVAVVAARRGLLAAAIATAEDWLLEPAQPASEPVAPAPARPRPVIAVFGLSRGCGTTVVARALAAELGARDPAGAAAVICEARAAGIPLATQAATRLARALEDVPGASTRAVGRLCLIAGADELAVADSSRHLAPLVLDAGSASLGGVAASLADRTVLVTTPAIEPALAPVAASCLARVGPDPCVVLNRARQGEGQDDPDRSDPGAPQEDRGYAAPDGSDPRPPEPSGSETSPGAAGPLVLPESRMGAQLALGGREARGDLGRAIAKLADRCGATA
jgi:hypothetical protein